LRTQGGAGVPEVVEAHSGLARFLFRPAPRPHSSTASPPRAGRTARSGGLSLGSASSRVCSCSSRRDLLGPPACVTRSLGRENLDVGGIAGAGNALKPLKCRAAFECYDEFGAKQTILFSRTSHEGAGPSHLPGRPGCRARRRCRNPRQLRRAAGASCSVP
jgi:hypothetical protein